MNSPAVLQFGNVVHRKGESRSDRGPAALASMAAHPPASCRCGAVTHFKPTIGAYVCLVCRRTNFTVKP